MWARISAGFGPSYGKPAFAAPIRQWRQRDLDSCAAGGSEIADRYSRAQPFSVRRMFWRVHSNREGRVSATRFPQAITRAQLPDNRRCNAGQVIPKDSLNGSLASLRRHRERRDLSAAFRHDCGNPAIRCTRACTMRRRIVDDGPTLQPTQSASPQLRARGCLDVAANAGQFCLPRDHASPRRIASSLTRVRSSLLAPQIGR